MPVSVAKAEKKSVPLQLSSIGHVEASASVSIVPRVGGPLTEIHFKEGQDVMKGAILFRIDPLPYETALNKSEAFLAKDKALAAQAAEEVKRYSILAEKGYVSKEEFGQIRANWESLEATVKADTAQVENDRLTLGYCTIRSPIDGRSGDIFVSKGNIVKANDTVLVTLNTIHPVYVGFSLAEQHLPAVKKYDAAGALEVDAIVPNDEATPVRGILTFIDNAVDSSTGTVLLKGTFANREYALWPGQSVDVVLTLAVEEGVTVIPAAALQTGQNGRYVYAVKEDSSVEIRSVHVERTLDDQVVVRTGIQPGETVVTDGQLQLVPGSKVEIIGASEKTEGARK